MGVTAEQLAKLNEPTPSDEIKQRPIFNKQKVKVGELDYIDARFVMDRLDGAVGPANWRDEYRDAKQKDGIVGRIGILCETSDGSDEWVWKEDVGTESNIENTKGSYSDAFKRTAVKWGVARDLYDDREGKGRTHQAAGQSSTAHRAATNKPKSFKVSNDEAPWVCPDHEGVVAWPAGETSTGRKYDAFYACPKGKACENRAPKGLKVEPQHLKGSEMDSLPF